MIQKLEHNQREYYFIILLAVILVVLVIAIAIISLQGASTPTQRQISAPTPEISLSTDNEQQDKDSHIVYNKVATSKLLSSEEKRTQLTQSDKLAKAHILRLLPAGRNYGVVHTSPTSTIEYVQSFDLFEIEILTINVQQAKTEAENWFKAQGMSQQGICALPLNFYLNWEVANILKTSNFIFNPLPDGC